MSDPRIPTKAERAELAASGFADATLPWLLTQRGIDSRLYPAIRDVQSHLPGLLHALDEAEYALRECRDMGRMGRRVPGIAPAAERGDLLDHVHDIAVKAIALLDPQDAQ